VFATLQRLRDSGVTILMVEQNAKAALAISDYGIVLELGQPRMHDRADKLLCDPRVGQLFLRGHVENRVPHRRSEGPRKLGSSPPACPISVCSGRIVQSASRPGSVVMNPRSWSRAGA